MSTSPRCVCHHRGHSGTLAGTLTVTNFQLHLDSTSVSRTSSFCPGVPPRTPCDIESPPLLRLPWVTVSQISLVCGGMMVRGGAGWVRPMSLHWDSPTSSHGWTGPMPSGAEPQSAPHLSSRQIGGGRCECGLLLCCGPWSPGRGPGCQVCPLSDAPHLPTPQSLDVDR